MPLLIKNGRVITATEDYQADVYCAGETITRIEAEIDPNTVRAGGAGGDLDEIDAAGMYVFPGFIDPHVHIHLPFMGTHAKDTWATASRAALVGGTTTLLEMVCPGKAESPAAAYATWLGKARGEAECEYGFHLGVTRFDGGVERELRELVRGEGVRSFKVFLAYKGALGIDDRELYHTLRLARELGVIVAAHCENETLVAERQAELLAAGKTGPEWHEPSRPVEVEAAGVAHLMAFAEATGAEVYIVHTSCDEAVREARRGIERGVRGVRGHIEVVLPHLVLDRSYAERGSGAGGGGGNFEGAKYVMSPPLRERGQLEKMWGHLAAGTIATVGTDHAPFNYASQKEMGRGDFTKIPNGIPSVEDRVNLLFTHGPAAGRLTLNQFVAVASTNAARIFGLRGKGGIRVGGDADLVVYDPSRRGTISAKTHRMATDYSAFEGWPIAGRPAVVTVRGRVMVRDGRLVEGGGPAWGRLVDRGPAVGLVGGVDG